MFCAVRGIETVIRNVLGSGRHLFRSDGDGRCLGGDLLGDQAALAIVSSQCFVSVDRKLKTVQGFLVLLKS